MGKRTREDKPYFLASLTVGITATLTAGPLSLSTRSPLPVSPHCYLLCRHFDPSSAPCLLLAPQSSKSHCQPFFHFFHPQCLTTPQDYPNHGTRRLDSQRRLLVHAAGRTSSPGSRNQQLAERRPPSAPGTTNRRSNTRRLSTCAGTSRWFPHSWWSSSPTSTRPFAVARKTLFPSESLILSTLTHSQWTVLAVPRKMGISTP